MMKNKIIKYLILFHRWLTDYLYNENHGKVKRVELSNVYLKFQDEEKE